MQTHSNETVKARAEYTDLFSGEANYSWVRRADGEFRSGISDREVMRYFKAQFDLTGINGRTDNSGDVIEFRPYGMNTVLFIYFTF